MAQLLVSAPGEPDRVVPLPDRPFLVGRGEGSDLLILERKASKRHCEIAPLAPGLGGPGTWVVTDLQSSNGTLVDGERILRRGIVHGDVVHVGDTTLTLVDPQPEAAPEAEGLPTGSSGGPPVVIISSLLLEPLPAAAPKGRAPRAAERVAREPEALRAVRDEGIDEGEEAVPAGGLSPDGRRSSAAGRRAIARGAFVLAAGIALLVVAEVVAGGVAQRRAASTEEAHEYTKILENREG